MLVLPRRDAVAVCLLIIHLVAVAAVADSTIPQYCTTYIYCLKMLLSNFELISLLWKDLVAKIHSNSSSVINMRNSYRSKLTFSLVVSYLSPDCSLGRFFLGPVCFPTNNG